MNTSKKPTELLPTRRSLLERLRNWEDQESWQEFFDTYWELIYGVAIKAGLTDAEAQDVVQETVISVAKNMRDFRYNAGGSFKAWLLGATRWRIVDQLRKRMPVCKSLPRRPEETSRTSTLDKIPCPTGYDLEASWNEEWRTHFRNVALERVKAKVNPKHFQIFDLYAVKQWPVQKVAQSLHVTVAQVYKVKSRIVQLMQKEAARLERTVG
jgi:RNA polymerase sigma factor (sigma-70 family)